MGRGAWDNGQLRSCWGLSAGGRAKPGPRLAVLAATGPWGVQGVASVSVSMVSGPWSPGRARVSGARRVPAFLWRAAGSERPGIRLLSPHALCGRSENAHVRHTPVMLGRKQDCRAGRGRGGEKGGGRSRGALPVRCRFECIPSVTSFNFFKRTAGDAQLLPHSTGEEMGRERRDDAPRSRLRACCVLLFRWRAGGPSLSWGLLRVTGVFLTTPLPPELGPQLHRWRRGLRQFT